MANNNSLHCFRFNNKSFAMKKGHYFLVLVVSFIFSCTAINAQETTQPTDRKNELGIRISSQDAAVNHSITYRRFFKPELNFTREFSFEPAAVGFSARFVF